MDTIDYYNKYASKIFEDTAELDTGALRQKFLELLEEGDTILDLGCGSGRDSLAFYDLGYDVTALDGSEEMCKLAEIHTGLEVLQIAYENMEFDEVFDGIWGYDAFIHVPGRELEGLLEKVTEALCRGGVLFLSFREGDFEGFQGERYFCDYKAEELERIIRETGRLKIEKIWTGDGADVDGREKRVFLLARKVS